MGNSSAFLGEPDSILGEVIACAARNKGFSQSRQSELLALMHVRMTQLVSENAMYCVDERGLVAVRLASAVLSAAQVLSAEIGRENAEVILREAIVDSRRGRVAGWLEGRMDVYAKRPEDAFDALSRTFKSRGEQTFGKGFQYVQDVLDEDRNYVSVRKCVFNDFFRRNGEAELTGIFCALDTLWADILNEGAYNVALEHPSTLAEGGDMCRFEFNRKNK